ncbi:unnamed protein product [Moneuplotes crassus]|uniref:Nuclear migration protein nudC n=1 Tax=Euplotes crassus TaxID=5936 RepID=A0AAD2CYP0_EUPCR|nr:unnamed protein product [Moneuplotes crassus]
MADSMFDGVLMNIVQKAEGIDGFYDAVFSFMRRKTDFYSNPDKARSTVLAQFERHLHAFNEDAVRRDLIKKKQEEHKKKQEEEEKARKEEEITDEEAEKLMNAQKEESSPPTPAPTTEDKKEGEGDESDDGVPPLIGNGLKTDTYSFTQTLSDITINVFIPDGIKAKNLDVIYSQKKLKVGIKGQPPILDGELFSKILADETLWNIETIEGQRTVVITLDKVDKMKWWESVVVGGEKINTKKIEPENSKLSDLDGETRQTVEKMMFDQQQKQKGLPTSDELEKKQKLQNFMDAHPEMDFSKAKFS